MKKQGIWVTRFIFLILFVFVMAFMGFHIFGALSDPVGTVSAAPYTVETTTTLDGWFVRDEAVVPAPDGIWELQVEDGRRVAKGDTLALTYRDEGVQRENRETRALAARLEQLEAISRYAADLADVSQLDNQILDSVLGLLSARDAGVMPDLYERSMTLKSLLYKRSYTYEGGQDVNVLIGTLSEQLERSRAQMGGALGRVEATDSGTFCAQADGYEPLLTPAALKDASVDDFLALTGRSPSAPSSCMGKLALNFTWYYAAVVPEGDIGRLEAGDTLSLRVDKTKSLTAKVYRVSPPENGRQLLVLEGDESLSALVSLRQVPAEIVFDSRSGLRIPREAVRLDNEGRTGVYCLVINQVKFKPVEVLLERDNYYLVAYHPEETGALLSGDEIVVKGKNLYDGKIVK